MAVECIPEIASAPEILLTNARIVLADQVVAGSLVLRGGLVHAIETGNLGTPAAVDCEGDHILPGLVDLHTDNLEKHYQPRAGVTWDAVAATLAHDGQMATAGITTTFDSITIGSAEGWDMRAEMVEPILAGLDAARGRGMLRIDHRLHLRCEVTHPRIVEEFETHAARHPVAMVSLMDHAPGDRQSPDLDAYRRRYLRIFEGDPKRVEAHVKILIEGSRTHGPANCRALAARAREAGIPLATHDDASPAHVADAMALGAVFSEFPTTLQAARTAHEGGLAILMGTPNLVRGGSHSGNVAAGELALAGWLDLLASDYIPGSLLLGAYRLTREPYGLDLPRAIGMASRVPAEVAGLTDRGRIAPGLRADLLRVREVDGLPVVREVLVAGRRIA